METRALGATGLRSSVLGFGAIPLGDPALDERDGGGVLISQAIHTLDLALLLAGPVEGVQAMARTTALHDMLADESES